jgi:hypothetical protein
MIRLAAHNSLLELLGDHGLRHVSVCYHQAQRSSVWRNIIMMRRKKLHRMCIEDTTVDGKEHL